MPRRIRDWRKLKYREELFLRYFTWRIKVHDLDHTHYCRTLTSEMTEDQKCWFSFLFGMTYRSPQAFAYWSTFPDFEELDIDEVEEWNIDNWKRTTYGTDARYNKGHFASQTGSLMEWAAEDEETLLQKVKRLTSEDCPSKNFESLFAGVCEVFKFGRMTGWIACQCLYDLLDLNINFDNVMIRNPGKDSSMQSIWNGYCMLKGYEDKLLGKQYSTTDYKVSEEDLAEVSSSIMKYREKAQDYADTEVDIFKWESIWCQFKRLFNTNASKEYPGHSSGDAASRYPYYREHWPEVDWSLFRKALLTQESIIKGQTYRNNYNAVFGNTGLVLNLHEMFSDMPNAYELTGLNPNDNLITELFEDEGVAVPCL